MNNYYSGMSRVYQIISVTGDYYYYYYHHHHHESLRPYASHIACITT
jgi:hypothetical protein